MPEHLIEMGIGEVRWALIERDEIVEAAATLEGVIPAGTIIDAQLVDVGREGRNAIAVARGQEYLLPDSPPGITEGAHFVLEVTRETIPGPEAWKRPLGRAAKADWMGNEFEERTVAMPAEDKLGAAGWNDLIEEARSGVVRFEGGELRIALTPAMTLIDVDGVLPPTKLAVAGARAAAHAIRRHGVGGSIGIDLPTIAGKSDRTSVGEIIDAILPKPFERTAMNGFGFLQIVRPRRRASLFELAQDRAAFEARDLLRRVGRETGRIGLVAHPSVRSVLENRTDWLDALSRQVGGPVSLRADANLPLSGGYAEIL